MAFRSGLEEKVADLMIDLGVKYEYESCKVPYVIHHNYAPTLFFRMVFIWNVRDYGNLRIDGRSLLSSNNILRLI